MVDCSLSSFKTPPPPPPGKQELTRPNSGANMEALRVYSTYTESTSRHTTYKNARTPTNKHTATRPTTRSSTHPPSHSPAVPTHPGSYTHTIQPTGTHARTHARTHAHTPTQWLKTNGHAHTQHHTTTQMRVQPNTHTHKHTRAHTHIDAPRVHPLSSVAITLPNGLKRVKTESAMSNPWF